MERCLHSQAVGENKTADALLSVFHVLSVIWWYGSLSRTKSQGQISWLCRDNSWEKQTRKSLHFIKDPAGEHQSLSSSPPTLSIFPLLPPVWHYVRNTRQRPQQKSCRAKSHCNFSFVFQILTLPFLIFIISDIHFL